MMAWVGYMQVGRKTWLGHLPIDKRSVMVVIPGRGSLALLVHIGPIS
jgi:hypothetical protein